jgi:hypothetical protein
MATVVVVPKEQCQKYARPMYWEDLVAAANTATDGLILATDDIVRAAMRPKGVVVFRELTGGVNHGRAGLLWQDLVSAESPDGPSEVEPDVADDVDFEPDFEPEAASDVAPDFSGEGS